MNQSRAMARPFDDCLSCLLVLRLLLLTLVAVITTSTLLLIQPPEPGPSTLSFHAVTVATTQTAGHQPALHWFDDFPADSAAPESTECTEPARDFESRLDYNRKPRPIQP